LGSEVLAEMARVETAFAVLAVAVLACVLGAGADGSDHRYKEGDRVPLYANKVGPFHNPRYSDDSLAMRCKLLLFMSGYIACPEIRE
jgi:hypothetical protein